MFAEASGTESAREVCEHLIALGEAPVPPGALRGCSFDGYAVHSAKPSWKVWLLST